MATKTALPILSFSTNKPAAADAAITIDGRKYRLRSRDALSIAQVIRSGALMERCRALHQAVTAGTASAKAEREYKTAMAGLAVTALDAPEDLVRSLSFEEHMVITSVAFFGFRPGAHAKPRRPRVRQRGVK